MNSAENQPSPNAVHDRFGCITSGLQKSETLSGGNIIFHRKSSDSQRSQVLSLPSNDGFLIGISLVGQHRRRIYGENRATDYDFEENSIYLRDSFDQYKADLSGNFDFVLMEISASALEHIADGSDIRATELSRLVAHPDPTLGGLARAMFSPVAGNMDKSFLFIDQLAVAIGIHVIGAYGNTTVPLNRLRQGLSRRDTDTAKQLLLSRMSGDVSIQELAEECNLSRAAFLRMFRETTGRTPHRWLMQQRIEIARELLRNSEKSLGEISTICGFSGASHFSRAFLSATGMTPSLWRRG